MGHPAYAAATLPQYRAVQNTFKKYFKYKYKYSPVKVVKIQLKIQYYKNI